MTGEAIDMMLWFFVIHTSTMHLSPFPSSLWMSPRELGGSCLPSGQPFLIFSRQTNQNPEKGYPFCRPVVIADRLDIPRKLVLFVCQLPAAKLPAWEFNGPRQIWFLEGVP